MAYETPMVSVIVPMYNSEKYIGELLNSLLAQTFKNFEVIVVDDCSVDNSFIVVEGYLQKFEGRLNLMRTEKNSGGPSIPRNRGLELSRGKYVFFMDNDDALTNTALEEMFTLAENFQAEVVYCGRYLTPEDGVDFSKKMLLKNVPYCVDQPAFLTENIEARILSWTNNIAFWVPPWGKFLLRNFLIKNKIKFLPIIQEDSVWTLELLCLAKKFLLVPNACYIFRERTESLSSFVRQGKPDIKNIRRKMMRTVCVLKHIDDFMSKIPYFNAHSGLRYAIMNNFMMVDLKWTLFDCGDLPPHSIYEIFKSAFENELGDNVDLVACFYSNSIDMLRNLISAQQQLAQLTNSTPPPLPENNTNQ